MSKRKPKPDIRVSGAGIYVIDPITDAGRNWITKNVHVESWQRIGTGVVVDPHYIEDIVAGARADGLEVT